jgi:hypothetical protein
MPDKFNVDKISTYVIILPKKKKKKKIIILCDIFGLDQNSIVLPSAHKYSTLAYGLKPNYYTPRTAK